MLVGRTPARARQTLFDAYCAIAACALIPGGMNDFYMVFLSNAAALSGDVPGLSLEVPPQSLVEHGAEDHVEGYERHIGGRRR